MTAAPVKITASMVVLLTTCMTAENQYALQVWVELGVDHDVNRGPPLG